MSSRNPDRPRRRNELIIQCPSQTIRITSDSSYGSLLNQNISLGSNRICIKQSSPFGFLEVSRDHSRSGFDISVSMGIRDEESSSSQEEEQVEWEQDEEQDQDEESPSQSQTTQSRGLRQSRIDQLPLLRYRALRKPKGQPCSICLHDPQPHHYIRVLPCLHVFHQQCIDQWLSKCACCPLCKTVIL